MEKSQLRQLALDHAQGEIASDDYVRERGELIDAMMAGRLAIDRLPPTLHAPLETRASSAPTMQLETPTPQGPSPMYIGVGIAMIVVLGAAVALLWPDQPAITAPPVAAPIVPLKPIEKPPAEQLITTFVAENNWNESSTGRFVTRWQALTATQRSEAVSAPWFRDLTTGLRQEINARHALASLPGGGADRMDGMRLVQFARNLKLDGQYPNFGDDDRSSVPPTASAVADDGAKDTPQAAIVPVGPDTHASVKVEGRRTPQAPETSKTTDANKSNSDTPTTEQATARAAQATSLLVHRADTDASNSHAWFNALPASHHTLQLFVVTNLEKVQKLQAEHSDVMLRYLESPASSSRTIFYVVHGNFASPERAKAAFVRLPSELRKDQEFALIKSVAELRERIAAQPTQSTLAANTSTAYTLQLFVFGKRDNANKLLQQFPNLPLWVHASDAAPREYRVLLGRYDDAEMARSARLDLPGALTSQAGVAVVKRVADPSGPGISRE
jgi:septal ring-binding cell division protein DamX